MREKTCILWHKFDDLCKIIRWRKIFRHRSQPVYSFLYFSIQTLSLVMSLREAAPHMVMVDFSSPIILSI